MPWLKYHHKFSAYPGDFQWKYLGEARLSPGDLQELLREMADEYDFSEHYRGIDYVVTANAPAWVVKSKHEAALHSARSYQKIAHQFAKLMATAKPCARCKKAQTPPNSYIATHGLSSDNLAHCPLCGRLVFADTLKWLVPKYKSTISLLKTIAAQTEGWKIWRGDKEASSRRTAAAPLFEFRLAEVRRLKHLTIIQLTDRGKAEAAKHCTPAWAEGKKR